MVNNPETLTTEELNQQLAIYRERYDKFHNGEYDLKSDENSESVMMINYNNVVCETVKRSGAIALFFKL